MNRSFSSWCKTGPFIAALVLVLAGLPAASEETFVPACPDLPRFARDTIAIDMASLAEEESAYRSGRAAPDREDFLFTWLPARLFERLVTGTADSGDLPGISGLLFLSGHEGGRWLNRMFIEAGQPPIGSPSIRRVRLPALLALDRLVHRRSCLVRHGSRAAKRAELRRAFDTLVLTYGYNRGYLLEILRHPAEGSLLPEDYISCSGLLDCRYPSAGAVLSPLMPVREKLSAPTGRGWERTGRRLERRLPAAIERGERVWTDLLARREFSPRSHETLVDVSAQYLAINEAVMLLTAAGLAEDNETAMDRALLADTALTVWLGAYLIGLGQTE